MASTIELSISVPKPLFDQAETIAQQLNVATNELFVMAIEAFVRNQQSEVESSERSKLSSQIKEGSRDINQGDMFWVIFDSEHKEAGIPHPHVVIQDNVLNHSRINTVVTCALTSNIKRASLPGNVVLEMGEANLLKPSVVEVSKVSSLDKSQLGEYIGSLTEARISQIFAGMRFLQRSYFKG